MRRVDRLEFH
jgi:hypothetical protein